MFLHSLAFNWYVAAFNPGITNYQYIDNGIVSDFPQVDPDFSGGNWDA